MGFYQDSYGRLNSTQFLNTCYQFSIREDAINMFMSEPIQSLDWELIDFNSVELMVNLVTLADFKDMVLDGIGFEISTYSQVWAISAQS